MEKTAYIPPPGEWHNSVKEMYMRGPRLFSKEEVERKLDSETKEKAHRNADTKGNTFFPFLEDYSGFDKYPVKNGEGVMYQNYYPVTVIDKYNYRNFIGKLGKCLVITGGSKLHSKDEFFSPVSHIVMFLTGYQAGFGWKYYTDIGFQTVCVGSMVQDNTIPGKDTTKSFDFLFTYGFALGIRHRRKIGNAAKDDKKREDDLKRYLSNLVTDEARPMWIDLVSEDLPIVNFKDYAKCIYDAHQDNVGTTDGKRTLLQDFWFTPLGKTVVFHPGEKSDGKVVETTNSIKEYLLALCLQNKGVERFNKYPPIVIAASGGPTVTQNIILYRSQSPNLKLFSISGSNGLEHGTGAIPPSSGKTYEESHKDLLKGRLNKTSGQLYGEIASLMNDYEANVAYRQVEQANDFNNLANNLVFLLKRNQLTGQFMYDANKEAFDWHGFPQNTEFDELYNYAIWCSTRILEWSYVKQDRTPTVTVDFNRLNA